MNNDTDIVEALRGAIMRASGDECSTDEAAYYLQTFERCGLSLASLQTDAPEAQAEEGLLEVLRALIEARKHEQALSKEDHPQALAVSIAGENRVNREIANLAPRILTALQQSGQTGAELLREALPHIKQAYRITGNLEWADKLKRLAARIDTYLNAIQGEGA